MADQQQSITADKPSSTALPSRPAQDSLTSSASSSSTTAVATESSTRAAERERAMAHTNSWKPSMQRRQSWNKEDHKHALQMSGLEDKTEDKIETGPGSSEPRA